MHLKESAYNFIYDDLGKDQIVFYNSRTGALAVVHEDQYKQYKGFQEKGKEIEDAEFLKNLLKCGYLLPAEVDEKFLIKTNMMQGRYNKNLLSLTIAPTMACNFRCIYCFEKGHSSCDFFEDPKCKECKLLPVCMGGCPHSRVEGKTICHQLNFRMKDYLIEYTRTLVSTT